MYDVRTRLDQDLKAAVSRLRQLGGAVAVVERPGTIEHTCPFADEVDGIQASESREIGFATRQLVLERVNHLSAALDRMNAGEYGSCVECDELIPLARLDAIPEVQTCVLCQKRLERLGHLRPVIYGNGVRQQRNRRAERAAEHEGHRLLIFG
jgi:RNA polymerase-binding transcription factor DksA